MTGEMPRGLALNNPCNIKTSPKQTWQGEIKPTADPEGVLCQFDNMADGVRAAAKLLVTYHLKHNCKTITDIIKLWAPPDPLKDKNPTEAYIRNVASWSGIGALAPVDFTSIDAIEELVSCMALQEQGRPCIGDADLVKGVADAMGVDGVLIA